MKYYFLSAAVLLSIGSFAQVDVNRFSNIVQSVSTGSAAYGSGFKGMAGPAGKVMGDPYLDSAFRQSTFRFYKSGVTLSAPARYDLLNGEIEVRTTGGIRVLKNDLVRSYKSLVDNDSVEFVNASNYKFEETKMIGFLSLLSDGKIQLMKQFRLEIVKPTYNASLEVGDKNTHINKKDALFISVNGELFKLKGKKELLQLFGTEKDAVTSFADSNNLSFKKEEDLVEIFNFYNGRVKS